MCEEMSGGKERGCVGVEKRSLREKIEVLRRSLPEPHYEYGI
jgi:hypothetical protein